MTIKEAILKSLDEINDLTTYMDVHNHIVKNSYYDFGTAKTPASTISALLGDFIRNGDTRVKRIKQEGGTLRRKQLRHCACLIILVLIKFCAVR